jgi:phosphatidylglycerol:prolipoprotein diacylglycerol transferase
LYPILVKFGKFELRSYGLLLAISFISGIYLALYRARKRGIYRNHVMDLSIIIVLCAITGSRFLYVITHLSEFKGHWSDTINPIQSSGTIGIAGLSIVGGIVFSLAALIVYCFLKKISILELCDTLAPSFALGLGIGRVGCFLNGCCFGKPCRLPWCTVFPSNSPAGSVFPDITIHPAQLYSSLYGLIIFVVLIFLDRKKRPGGFLVSIFIMFYSLCRFVVDYVRYYEPSVQFTLLGSVFTINQAIVFFMFLLGLFLFGKFCIKDSINPMI